MIPGLGRDLSFILTPLRGGLDPTLAYLTGRTKRYGKRGGRTK